MVTPRVKPRTGHTAPLHGISRMHGHMHPSMQINCVMIHVQVLFYARNAHFLVRCPVEQEECQSSKLCICRLSKHCHVWRNGISLTPCIAPTCERECDLHEYAEFHGVDDMITKLNGILATVRRLSTDPYSKEGLPYVGVTIQQEVQAVCHLSRAGSRMPCVHVRPEHQHG